MPCTELAGRKGIFMWRPGVRARVADVLNVLADLRRRVIKRRSQHAAGTSGPVAKDQRGAD